jgi:hypothetical protein
MLWNPVDINIAKQFMLMGMLLPPTFLLVAVLVYVAPYLGRDKK